MVHLLSMDTRPKIRVDDTEYGFLMGVIRIALADPENLRAVRSEVMIMPSTIFARLSDTIGVGQIFTPLDDEHTAVYTVYWEHGGPIDPEALLVMGGQQLGIDIDPADRRGNPLRRQRLAPGSRAIRKGESYSGIQGFFNEDLAIGEGMGPIVSRANEHLGPSDKAIVHLRTKLFESIDRSAAGEPPVGHGSNSRLAHLRAEAALITTAQDWRLAVTPGECS